MRDRFERLRERVDCLVHGHRDVARAPAYAEALSGPTDKELRYCGACGAPVWLPVPHEADWPRTWAAAGLPNP